MSAFPTGFSPESKRCAVGLGHDRLESHGTNGAETLFGGLEQQGGEPVSAVSWSDRKTVDGTPPSVPSGDDRPYDGSGFFRYKQRRRGALDESDEGFDVVGAVGFGLRFLPQLQHSLQVTALPASPLSTGWV